MQVRGMGRGSGRDIWTLTPDLESLRTYNTARNLERAVGLARGVSHIDQDRR